jgi:integrase
MKLTAIGIKHAEPKEKDGQLIDNKLSDGKGLYLLVKKDGSGKYWRQAYRHLGKQKTLALGVYPEVSLAEARELCSAAHKLAAQGIDPNQVKRINKASQLETATNSFSHLADEWYAKQLPHWAESTAKKRRSLLDNDLIPYLGKRPISELETHDLLTCLQRIEKRGAIDTAHNGRQVLNQVCRYAKQTQRLKHNPATDLEGALSRKITHHRAAITDPTEFGKLLIKIDQYEGTPIIRTMLALAPLLFQRPGEVASMEWQEIDFKNKLWIIPKAKKKERNKRVDDHIVPLSNQAIKLLNDIKQLTGGGQYVFPGQRKSGTHANSESINKAIRTMGYCSKNDQSFHGFRASATTMLNERLGFRVDWIEQQTGHSVKDSLGRAYNRTKHLEQRTGMIQHWANYLDELRQQALSGNVITGKFRQQ